MGRSCEDLRDEVPEARALAVELDLNHSSDPGGLEEIGTCRTCGLIIAQDNDGAWSHQPSVGEIDAGETWLDRNPSNGTGLSGPQEVSGEATNVANVAVRIAADFGTQQDSTVAQRRPWVPFGAPRSASWPANSREAPGQRGGQTPFAM